MHTRIIAPHDKLKLVISRTTICYHPVILSVGSDEPRKPLLEPQVLPPLETDHVAEPHVGNLVHDHTPTVELVSGGESETPAIRAVVLVRNVVVIV